MHFSIIYDLFFSLFFSTERNDISGNNNMYVYWMKTNKLNTFIYMYV